MKTIEKSIDVEVPVSAAYDQWTQFEEFPRFMEGIVEVQQLDDTRLHWVAEVSGRRYEWDAKIMEQEPDRVIAWHSTEGDRNAGRVTFEPTGSGTRVSVEMGYEPEGAAASVGAALGLDGRQVSADLERFKDLVEGRQVASGGWRGTVEHGRVTEHDTGA
jgi:uncharacterized membrane protein